MVDQVIIGAFYRHYKGQLYQVKGLVRHSETLELLVLYETQYTNPQGKLWVRPLSMFLEKLPDGRQRFLLQSDSQ